MDFLVDFDETAEWDLNDLIDMQREAAGIVGRPVDMLTQDALDYDSNPYFRRSVLDHTETIYAV